MSVFPGYNLYLPTGSAKDGCNCIGILCRDHQRGFYFFQGSSQCFNITKHFNFPADHVSPGCDAEIQWKLKDFYFFMEWKKGFGCFGQNDQADLFAFFRKKIGGVGHDLFVPPECIEVRTKDNDIVGTVQ